MYYCAPVRSKQYLYFSKNKTCDLENNLNPKTNSIQPILKSLEKKFMDLYIPNRAVTIDESLLL
jgi:hypothetical protein